MFDLEAAISNWRKGMLAARISPDDVAELESHLREEIADLTKSGVSEEKAFHVAVSLLGDVKKLRREFSRGRWFRLLNFRNNPPALNFIAAGFLLLGCNALADLGRCLFIDWTVTNPYFFWLTLGLYFLFGLQLLVGLGLAFRSNFWRCGALTSVLLILSSEVFNLVNMLRNPVSFTHRGYYYPLMGVFIPSPLQWVTGPVEIVFVLWAGKCLLCAPVRRIFLREKTRLKTVN